MNSISADRSGSSQIIGALHLSRCGLLPNASSNPGYVCSAKKPDIVSTPRLITCANPSRKKSVSNDSFQYSTALLMSLRYLLIVGIVDSHFPWHLVDMLMKTGVCVLRQEGRMLRNSVLSQGGGVSVSWRQSHDSSCDAPRCLGVPQRPGNNSSTSS